MSNTIPDTIYALSSAVGRAGIAVVRVSGPAARNALMAIADSVPAPRTAKVLELRAPSDGSIIDQAIVLWMPAPHSFTGQDTAEFHVHGGRAVAPGDVRL